MGFFLQKVLTSFLEPPGLFISIALFFGLFARKKGNESLKWITLAVIIYFFSTGIGIRLLLPPNATIPRDPQTSSPQVIIVLGGGTYLDTYQNRFLPGPFSLLRLHQGYTLWQKEKIPVLVSGGQVWVKSGPSEAEIMADILLQWGVPQDDIITESRSRNTKENAQYCSQILNDKHWNSFYLVTSEVHLKRAIRNFQSFLPDADIIPVSAHPPYDRTPIILSDFLPSTQAFSAFAQIIHEYFGLIALFFNQRID
ncbi:MAG: YdcF family protein [Candidatus Atribacteria bacterium]|nr:YdcF family protein [Candidatus Atribacteria bacterium]